MPLGWGKVHSAVVGEGGYYIFPLSAFHVDFFIKLMYWNNICSCSI